MHYALLIYTPEGHWETLSEDERNTILAEYGKLSADLRASGQYVGGEQLQPVTTATAVRVRDGSPQVTDGPFAETKEVLGGIIVVEADSLDDAIELAARVPSARHGTIEVRPVVMRTAEVPA